MNKLIFPLRLLQIIYVLAKYGLDKLLVSFSFFSAFRFITYLNPWHWCRKKNHSEAEALCLALEELGPIFVKFGQALSTRRDLLSHEFTDTLARLQDHVLPFPSSKTQKILAKAYGKPAAEMFATFDEVPLASASMAQVHAATLKTGQKVVVKVLRPNIYATIKRDVNVMRVLARLIDFYLPSSKQFKPKEVVEEFATSLFDELDLMREAANASQLRRNFTNSSLLYVPEVYWDYTRDNVLVLERIDGIPISNIDQLDAAGINRKKLAEVGLEIFFRQVFNDCFFHADMHPGNIFVARDQKEQPQYICVDFGIIGTLTDSDKRYLARNLLAFFNRDYRRVALLHIESGWVPAHTRPDAFESAIRTVCEPIFEKPLKEISFGQVMVRLFQTCRRFHMEVQPQLILLQKTLLAIEGLGRQLYPDLNLWNTAKPFLERWIRQQIGPQAFVDNLKEQQPFFAEQLPHLPRLIFEVQQQQKLINEHTIKSKQPTYQTNKFKQGLGVGLLSLPITGYFLERFFLSYDMTLVGAAVSLMGAFLILTSNQKT